MLKEKECRWEDNVCAHVWEKMMEEEEGAIVELPLDDYMGHMLALELHPHWSAGTL
jgi:hypothetical protein